MSSTVTVGEAKASSRPTAGLVLKEKVGQRFETALPVGEISAVGREELIRLIHEAELPEPGEGEFEWVWETPRGTLPKRLLKWMKKAHKVDPGQRFLASLGATARRLTGDARLYRFTIEPPPFEWKDGLYGKRNSCWWTQNQKEYWEVMDGHAALFYEAGWGETAGIGRVWIAQIGSGCCLLVNGYYANDEKTNWTQILTHAIATCWGVSYLRVEIESRRMHINSGLGYLIGNQTDITSFVKDLPKPAGLHRVRLDPPEVRRVHCASCNVRLRRQEDERETMQGIYCGACYEVYFFRCGRCASASPRHERRHVFGENWCGRCIQRYTFDCVNCGEFFRSEISLIVADLKFCPTCFITKTFRCGLCETRVPDFERREYRRPACPLCGECENHEPVVVCADCYIKCQNLNNDHTQLL